MSRPENVLARSIMEMCKMIWHGPIQDEHFEACPLHKDCGKMPDDQCFHDLLDWMADCDPGDHLGPGNIEIVPAPRPATQEDEDKATLSHYTMLLHKLAMAVPLPGAPTYAECVDKAIEIIERAEGKR